MKIFVEAKGIEPLGNDIQVYTFQSQRFIG